MKIKTLSHVMCRRNIRHLSGIILSLYSYALAIPTIKGSEVVSFSERYPLETLNTITPENFDTIFSKAKNDTDKFFLAMFGIYRLEKKEITWTPESEKVILSPESEGNAISYISSHGTECTGPIRKEIQSFISKGTHGTSSNTGASNQPFSLKNIFKSFTAKVAKSAAKGFLETGKSFDIPRKAEIIKENIESPSQHVELVLDTEKDINPALIEIFGNIPCAVSFSVVGDLRKYISQKKLLEEYSLSSVYIKDDLGENFTEKRVDALENALESRKNQFFIEDKQTALLNEVLQSLSKNPCEQLVLQGAGGKFVQNQQKRIRLDATDPDNPIKEPEYFFVSNFFGDGMIDFSGLALGEVTFISPDPSYIRRVSGLHSEKLKIIGNKYNSSRNLVEVAKEIAVQSTKENMLSMLANIPLNPAKIEHALNMAGFNLPEDPNIKLSSSLEKLEKHIPGSQMIDKSLRTYAALREQIVVIAGYDSKNNPEEEIAKLINLTKATDIEIKGFPASTLLFDKKELSPITGISLAGCPISSPIVHLPENLKKIEIKAAHLTVYSDQMGHYDVAKKSEKFIEPGDQYDTFLNALTKCKGLEKLILSHCRIDDTHMNHFLIRISEHGLNGEFSHLKTLDLSHNGAKDFSKGVEKLCLSLSNNAFPELREINLTVRSSANQDTIDAINKLKTVRSTITVHTD